MSEMLNPEDVIRAYRSIYDMDVSRFFPARTVELVVNQAIGYRQFMPAMAGDEVFYSELMSKRGYESVDKWDFVKASEFIGPDSKVLDIGCGIGRFSAYCSHYKGIEFNETAIAEGRSVGRDISADKLSDLPAETFDIVTLFQVLEHVESPMDVLAEAARLLKDGGILVVTVPNAESFMGKAPNLELNCPPHHLTWWTEDALVRATAAIGLVSPRTWREPLARAHLAGAIEAIVNPRKVGFFDRSLKSFIIRKFAGLLRRVLPKSFDRIPTVLGHSIMVVATKSRNL
jgi:SAM-dependent methyltransferase